MDESALRAPLNSLYSSRSSLDGWMTFWTLLVGIGVVAEVAFVIRKHLDAMETWRRGIVPPEKPSRLWFLFELIAVGLVAAGVSGELAIEARTGTLETQIRELNNQRALLRQKPAGDANESAKGAAEAAQRAKAAAAEAETELKILRSQVTAASVRARTPDVKDRSLASEIIPASPATANSPAPQTSAIPQ